MDTALSRILADVLALEDITEAESHRLCELCHIMNSLEGLFVEDPDEPSFVVSYVPSWLKFSYLSELLVRPLLVSNGNRQYRRHNSRKLRLRTFRICLKRALWWTLRLKSWSSSSEPCLPTPLYGPTQSTNCSRGIPFRTRSTLLVSVYLLLSTSFAFPMTYGFHCSE